MTKAIERYEAKVKIYAFLFLTFLIIGLVFEHGIPISVPEWKLINPDYSIILGTIISLTLSFVFLMLLYRLSGIEILEESQ